VLTRSYAPSDAEVYDYPGHYLQKSNGEQYAEVRIDEFGSQFETAQAVTNAKGVAVGSMFTLETGPRDDQNVEHLILSANYDLEFGDYEAMPEGAATSYRCSFVAMSSAQQFRPRRTAPKPFVQGPQTAVVVGPGGEEINVDKFGRVKVQFHWDRQGKKDDASSCWVRVATTWAGKQWGAISIPRIGQEVVVDFLEGDPDRPIIVGSVYNADMMPPYALPANRTQSGIKSRSSLGGSPDNFNEIRFEDKKGSEQIVIHAEKDKIVDVEHDRNETVGNDETYNIGHDQSTDIGRNQTFSVGNDQTVSIGKNRTESVGANETISIDGARSESVSKDESITIGGGRTKSVGKDESVDIGANRTIAIAKNETASIGESRSTEVGKDDTTKVGKNFVLDAGDAITIKTGDASITMKKDGTIQIKGKDITINGSGKINVKASSDVVIKGSKVTAN